MSSIFIEFKQQEKNKLKKTKKQRNEQPWTPTLVPSLSLILIWAFSP
jgi:hypothetical protein